MPMEMYTLGLPQERQTLVRVSDERPSDVLLEITFAYMGENR